MIPTREVYWNIHGYWIMYALLVPTLAIFVYGFYLRLRPLVAKRFEWKPDRLPKRLWIVVVQVFLHHRLLKERSSGLVHLSLFWSFLVLFAGTAVVFLQQDLGWHLMAGDFYLWFQSLALDVFGALAALALVFASYRRYLERLPRLRTPARLDHPLADGLLLSSLLVVILTGFLLEGMRIAVAPDPWASWSPVGSVAGRAFGLLQPDSSALRGIYTMVWWFHLVVVLALIAYLPYSKLLHALTAPVNVFIRALDPPGELALLNVEASETLGACSAADFNWKQLVDFVSCTGCGRCQSACPASSAGKPLSPKALILGARGCLDGLTQRGAAPPRLVGPAIAPEALWACTTCGACMEQCPLFVHHVPAIIDMRRYMVMEEADYPVTLQEAILSLEDRGHPFKGTRASRLDWCTGLNLKVVGKDGPGDVLYWVGCKTALDERLMKVARAFCRRLQEAGVDFAILGMEENCTGDPARRIGNEYLFQKLATENIATLQRYGISKIVTTCPHCYNVFKNEYPKLGIELRVYHHSEFLAQLIVEGRLPQPSAISGTFTFHDPCYLGRYNGVYDQPRAIIHAEKGGDFREMRSSRAESFCCGSGGGMFWVDEDRAQRISHLRAEQVRETGASTLVTACPFCLSTLEDALKTIDRDQPVQVMDLAEVVKSSLGTTAVANAVAHEDFGGQGH